MSRMKVELQSKGVAACLLLSLMGLAGCFQGGYHGKTAIVTDGGSDYRIVIPDHAAPPVVFAAGELQSYLQQISGVKLPVVKESEAGAGPAFVVGPTRKSEDLIPASSLAALKDDGVLIKTIGQDIYLRGGNDRGQIYSVYSLLEKYLGVRFLAEDCTVVPAQKSVALPRIDYSYAPPFFYRDMLDSYAYHRDISLHQRLNGDESPLDKTVGGKIDIPNCHTFFKWIPPEKYYKDHPEYFSLMDGKRNCAGYPGGGQLCLTNPDVLKTTIHNVLHWLDEHPGATVIDISQMDTEGKTAGCQCDKCRAVVAEEGSESGALLRFVNAVANEVAKKYPDKWVSTLAYQYTVAPPKITKPAPNVIIRLCHTGCVYHGLECSAKGSTAGYSTVQFTMRGDLAAWSKITSNIVVWHYGVNFSSFLAPCPNLEELAKDIRYYAAHRVRGLFVEGDYLSPGGELGPLRRYLIAQLLWNPNCDPQQIREEFCRGYYGGAAANVLTFLAWMDKEARHSKSHPFVQWKPEESLSREFVVKGLKLLERARSKVGTPELANRIDLLRLPLWYMQLTYPAKFSQPDNAPELLQRVKTLLEKNQITAMMEQQNSVRGWLSQMDEKWKK